MALVKPGRCVGDGGETDGEGSCAQGEDKLG